MFKLKELEPDCEDYGQAVIYKGTMEDHPYVFSLDNHHRIHTGKVREISMLSTHYDFSSCN